MSPPETSITDSALFQAARVRSTTDLRLQPESSALRLSSALATLTYDSAVRAVTGLPLAVLNDRNAPDWGPEAEVEPSVSVPPFQVPYLAKEWSKWTVKYTVYVSFPQPTLVVADPVTVEMAGSIETVAFWSPRALPPALMIMLAADALEG